MNIEEFFFRLGTPEGKIYLDFIKSCKIDESKQIEVHHIQPRALGGSNDVMNLVKLNVYDHILAHIYLAKAIPCQATLLPITWMSRKSVKNLTDLEKISLEKIEEWKELRERASRKSSEIIHNSEVLSKSVETSQKTRAKKYGTCTKYLHTDEIHKKIGDTIAERYHGDRAGQLHTPWTREKAAKTRFERYGTIGPILSEESKKKALFRSQQTCLERYGKLGREENFKDPEVHRKAVENSKKSRTTKYGSPTGAMNTLESQEKAKSSRKKTLAFKQEIRKTREFEEWWEENKGNYKNSWYAVGYYIRDNGICKV